MSHKILILGETGSGKSTSIESLEPKETFIINCINKDLPFKGWRSKYKPYSKDNPDGNIYATTNPAIMLKLFEKIKEMQNIKYVVIDDFQYIMSFEFMERAKERGYDKFTEIGQNAFKIIKAASELRDDQIVIFLSHSEDIVTEGLQKTKMKTIGRMLDEKITPEGLFSIVLIAKVSRTENGTEYYFETNSSGSSTAKSPKGMFPAVIPNDLKYVIDKFMEYQQN